MKLRDRVDKIARVVYGADGVSWSPEAEAKAKRFEADPSMMIRHNDGQDQLS